MSDSGSYNKDRWILRGLVAYHQTKRDTQIDEIIVTVKIRQDERDAKPYLCGVVEINDCLLVNYQHGDLGVDLTELAKTLDIEFAKQQNWLSKWLAA